MAINKSDFNKIWASTSPLTPYTFTENNYKEGWNFIGATPPARQMWDFLQKNNDEKMQFIVNDLLVPVDIDETANSGNYYSTSVPSEKVFANFDSIGGKTIAWNQLCDYGTITLTGGSFSIAFTSGVPVITGHKYYITAKITTTNSNPTVTLFTLVGGSPKSVGSCSKNNPQVIFTSSYDATSTGSINVEGGLWTYGNGFAADDTVENYMLVDLTRLFGAGNEPSTVAEFEALFPASYYSYNAGTLLSAGVSNVISKDSSNNVVANMPIPSAIQSLDGYGWSAGSVYNYIDFERKKFVKRIASVDLGGLTWTGTSQSNVFQAGVTWIKVGTLNFIDSKYVNAGAITIFSTDAPAKPDKTVFTDTQQNRIFIKDSAYSDAPTLTASLDGVMLYYELATPVETDISAILGASGIATSSGGSLTFQNSNGDNYRLPVPVSMDYVADADGLMTAQDKAKLDMIYDYIQRVGL